MSQKAPQADILKYSLKYDILQYGIKIKNYYETQANKIRNRTNKFVYLSIKNLTKNYNV